MRRFHRAAGRSCDYQRLLRVEPLEDRRLLSGSQTLGSTALVEGPAAGSDSDLVQSAAPWTATANASWLHTTASGSASGLAIFTFDVNTGPTRTGTLTIAGATLTVTQAGNNYMAPNSLTTLASGVYYPQGVAVDSSGNVYIADVGAIEEWNAATQTVSTRVSGLYAPNGVAVDGAGNIYIDSGDAIEEWNTGTQTLGTLVSSGLSDAQGVAVDGSGNVYIADAGDNAIKEWNAATQILTTLVSSGLNAPDGVAVDGAGNVCIADSGNNAVKEWNASTRTISTLVSSTLLTSAGLGEPEGLAVDGSGNVYIANDFAEWNAATQTVSRLASSGLGRAYGVAADNAGNVYVADYGNNAIEELPRAFVSAAGVSEGPAAGNDTIPAVAVPSSEPLTGVFAPASDQSWLTLGSVSGRAVNFSFTANMGPASRTAHISLLGQEDPGDPNGGSGRQHAVRSAPPRAAIPTPSPLPAPGRRPQTLLRCTRLPAATVPVRQRSASTPTTAALRGRAR